MGVAYTKEEEKRERDMNTNRLLLFLSGMNFPSPRQLNQVSSVLITAILILV